MKLSERNWRMHPKQMVMVLTLLLLPVSMSSGQSIVNTPHNLSASGPSAIRAGSEEQICIFCHSVHNAAPVQPLWNRTMPAGVYAVYSSNALDALPGQPTGSSKLCLSCHDGTIALGSVISRTQTIQMAGGITTLPPGSSNLGTDLSDDHPISFRYDTSLVVKDPKLTDPALLPPSIKLDALQELQCTACHEAHDNSFGNFLVMSNAGAALCLSCHQISTTTITAHQDCISCHKTHTAPSGPYLLQGDRTTTTCLTCHDGSHATAPDIASLLTGLSVHDTNTPVDQPNPIPGHVTCADCHNPHTMTTGSAVAPAVHPNFGSVSGVNASGSPIETANFQYEVCFKCHGDQSAATASWIPRQITQTNTRLEFALSSVSFHPVEGPGQNNNVPSLKPGWTEASVLHCSDCHGSDTSQMAGGTGPNGVHGSNFEPLLLARYETADFTPESAAAYALCYRCHDRSGTNGILQDRSFIHDKHVRKEDAACSICHDAHGISSAQGSFTNNSHLINFNTSIVFPNPDNGILRFQDTGTFSGTCTLLCHGKNHNNKSYSQ